MTILFKLIFIYFLYMKYKNYIHPKTSKKEQKIKIKKENNI